MQASAVACVTLRQLRAARVISRVEIALPTRCEYSPDAEIDRRPGCSREYHDGAGEVIRFGGSIPPEQFAVPTEQVSGWARTSAFRQWRRGPPNPPTPTCLREPDCGSIRLRGIGGGSRA